jgi:heat shock protein HslJ
VNRPTRIAIGLTCIAALLAACAEAPAPPSDAHAGLMDTAWTVATIDGTAVVPDAKPTIAFAANGAVSGSAGCNQYSGPYRVEGDRISIGDIASTLMLCDGDRGAQEAAFLGALRGAQAWRVTPEGDLELSGSGTIVASPGIAEAPPSDAPVARLPGTRWDLVEMGNTGDFARIMPTIEFGADGTVSGFAACNMFTGTFATDGDTVTLGPLATTRKLCVRPASAVEEEYLRALSGVTSWSIMPDGHLLLGGTIPLRYRPR